MKSLFKVYRYVKFVKLSTILKITADFHIWKLQQSYIIANCRRFYIEELWQLAFLQICIKIFKK
jgi:hypothetical protein